MERSSGSALAEVDLMDRSMFLDMGVSSGFTSTRVAPFCFAYTGSMFAGDTASEVPTTNIRLHEFACIMALLQTSWGSASPNQTTSGLSMLPHLQRGGSSKKLQVIFSLKSQTV